MTSFEYYFDDIASIECIGSFEDEFVYDIEIDDDTHTFIANDILVHNSTYTRGDIILQTLDVDIRKHSQRELAECLKYIFEHKMNKVFADKLETVISKRFGTNVMDFELELIGGKGIFMEKKKYILTTLIHDGEYVGHKGWFKSTGIEIQQAGSSKLMHDVIKTFVNIIFTKWNEMTDKMFFQMCATVKQQLQTASVDDLAKINRLRTYDDYVICDREKIELKPKAGATVKGAARYNHLIHKNHLQNKYPYLKSGMRVKWFYDVNGDSFAYPDDVWPYEIVPQINVNLQLEKLTFNPIKRLATGLFKSDMDQIGNSAIQRSFNVLNARKT